MPNLKPAIGLAALAVAIVATAATPDAGRSWIPPNGFVPDSTTAARIAEAVWIGLWGEEQVAREKPFKVTLKGDVWTVKGKDLPPMTAGGVAEAEISKVDGRILRVIHGQ